MSDTTSATGPLQFSSLGQMVQHFESGDYSAAPTAANLALGSTASGAYQFTNTTWNQYAAAVPGASQYGAAYLAPPAVQDAVFQQAVQSNGLNDWTCPGCNSALTSYLASNSSAYTLPVLASAQVPGGPAVQEGYGTPASYDPTDPTQFNPNLGGGAPYNTPGAPAVGAAIAAASSGPTTVWTGLVQAIQSATKGVLGTVQNLAVRTFLILAGIVLLGVAAWGLMSQSTRNTIKGAVKA
jgi:hypothetical protein